MTSPPDSKRQSIIYCFWIVLLGTLAYSNHLNNPFQFDTVTFLPENRLFLEPENILTWEYFTSQYFSRGLLFMSFGLNTWLHGMEPFGFHVTNLLLHLINGILVYFVVARSFQFLEPESNPATLKWISLFVALAFVCHPIQTESVSYVISRSEVLAGTFYLGAFFAIQLLWDRQNPAPVARQLWLLPLALLTGVGLGFSVKQTLITLPMMVFLYYLSGASATSPLKQFVLKNKNSIAVAIAIFLCGLFYKLFSDEHFLIGPSTAGEVIGRKNYMLTQGPVIVFYYLRLILFPFNLNVDPDIPMVESLASAELWAAWGILFALGFVLIFKTRSPFLRFWACWFFIVLSPSSSIVTLNDLAAEHRVYLALLGALVLIGWCLNTFYENAGRILNPGIFGRVVLLSLLILFFCAGTLKRNQVWAHELTLWHDAEKKSPHKLRPLVNLGRAYSIKGNIPLALDYYERALNISPNVFELNYNVGVLYQEANRLDDALKRFQLAALLKPHIPDVHGRLGQMYLAKKDFERAKAHLIRAVELNPRYSEGFRNLGVLHYYHLNERAQGIAFLKRSLFLNPNQQGAELIRNLIENSK